MFREKLAYNVVASEKAYLLVLDLKGLHKVYLTMVLLKLKLPMNLTITTWLIDG